MNNSAIKTEKTALFISPHLDDVAFSCGGTLAKMRAQGWRTILCTVFTKSVPHPQGFALACQLDKNLAPEVDYMKLRRAEDSRAAKILGVAEVMHLNFLEAPHRGYQSAAELFAGVKKNDEVWKSVAEHFALLETLHQPEIVFAPQGLGNHCDHLQTIRAALDAFAPEQICWYRDTPYAIRQPAAIPSEMLSSRMNEGGIEITNQLEQKIAACAAYASQINFQFGDNKQLSDKLLKFHADEAKRLKSSAKACENFLAQDLTVENFEGFKIYATHAAGNSVDIS